MSPLGRRNTLNDELVSFVYELDLPTFVAAAVERPSGGDVSENRSRTFDCTRYWYRDAVKTCLHRHDIGPESLLFMITGLPKICAGRPVQGLHAWMIRACQYPPLLSGSPPVRKGGGSAVFFLPTHLPVCPVPAEAPKSGRARSRWAAERSAWKMTEWRIAFYNYFDMGCCKTHCEYQDLLGSWHVSAGQSSAAHGLFRRLVPLCQNRASSDWTRGRKSPFEAL